MLQKVTTEGVFVFAHMSMPCRQHSVSTQAVHAPQRWSHCDSSLLWKVFVPSAAVDKVYYELWEETGEKTPSTGHHAAPE